MQRKDQERANRERIKIKTKDFEQWKENPVTQWFFSEIEECRDAAQEYWQSASWSGDRLWHEGRAGDLRIACRSRAEACQDILEMEPEEENEEQERNLSD